MPSYFPENNTPLALDTETKSLQKINDLLQTGIVIGEVEIVPGSDPLPVSLRDGSGTAITSTSIGGKQRLDVNLSSAGSTGSAVPSTANVFGGTDGTNLRAVRVDTNGRLDTSGTTAAVSTFTTNGAGTLAASDVTRKYFSVYNSGPATLNVLLGTGTPSATNFSVAVLVGELYENVNYTGAIQGFYASASNTARITIVT